MFSNKYLKQVIEELFEDFLLDSYIAKKISSSQDMSSLLKRITSLLEQEIIPAVKRQDIERIAQYSYKLGEIHFHLQIPGPYIFKYINKFKTILELHREFLNLEHWEIYFWIKYCKKYVALSYVENKLKNAIDNLEGTDLFSKYIVSLFKDLLEIIRILVTNNKPSQEISKDINEFFNKKIFPKLENNPIEEYLNSVEFQIKSYFDLDLKLKLELEYKDFRELTLIFIEYLIKERFEYSVYILEKLINSTYLMLERYRDIENNWRNNYFQTFLRFLTNTYYSNGLVKTITVLTESEKLKKELLNSLYEELSSLEKKSMFVFNISSFIVVYLDFRSLKYQEISNTINEIISKIGSKDTVSLLEEIKPTIVVGEVDSRRFHNLSFLLAKETFELMLKHLKEINIKHKAPYIIENLTYIFEDFFLEALKNLKLKETVLATLKKRELHLFAQPIVDLFNKQIFGFEILSRIKVDNDYVSPALFLDFLIQQNLTIHFDLSVLETLYKVLDKIELKTQRLFVNLFPNSLLEGEVVAAILKLLEKMENLNLVLVLELTEYSVVTKREILEKIQQGNLEIAFDDFGSGYTNFRTVGMLASLKRAKYLKIDGELVKGLQQNTIYENIIKGIVTFAKDLNMDIVFEHVSDEGILNRLKALSEEFQLERVYGQGYLFGKPQPLLS